MSPFFMRQFPNLINKAKDAQKLNSIELVSKTN